MGEILGVRIAYKLAEIKNKPRTYGLYDYSGYPGEAPPFQIKEEETGRVVHSTWDEIESETIFVNLTQADEAARVTAVFVDFLNELSEKTIADAEAWPMTYNLRLSEASFYSTLAEDIKQGSI